jgi:hypothetical protein
VLWGKGLTGKTAWARSLGDHFFARNKFNGAEFAKVCDDVRYYVLDDMTLKHFTNWKEFLGCQTWYNIRAFHRDPPMVRAGKPCIWLSNHDIREEAMRDPITGPRDAEWLEDNCTFVYVEENFFYWE